jgi:membrane-bound serine protease (ClpP class)
MVGETGVAKSVVSPEGGHVFVHGELWSASSAAEIPVGTRVRVTAVDGLRITVEPARAERVEA